MANDERHLANGNATETAIESGIERRVLLKGPLQTGTVLQGGRFTIEKQLGSGGMGAVYQALDHARSTRVALKLLTNMRPESIAELKREFRALAGIVHPNLVAFHELVFDGELGVFTMELVEGQTFLDYHLSTLVEIAPAGDATVPLTQKASAPQRRGPRMLGDPDALRETLGQLAMGIHALHAAGVLHLDLKPGNVMVTREGRVVILDFGLARAAHVAQSDLDANQIAGTPAYMAPEQAMAETASSASDWYALGVILYEALTGQLPFAGTTARILFAKQTRDASSPASLNPEAPSDLVALCEALLQRNPDDRPDGTAVLRALGVADGAFVPPAVSRAPRSPDAPFVGRADELRALHRAFQHALSGETVLAYVEGESGIGKSTLLEHFLDELAYEDGPVILRGRCYEREAVPFKGFDNAVDALQQYLLQLPKDERAQMLPAHAAAMARLFPVLAGVPGFDTESGPSAGPQPSLPAEPTEIRRLAFAAMRELLARVAGARGLVIQIDDLQWGDVESARLVASLLQTPRPNGVLLVFSYRSDEMAASPCLQALEADPVVQDTPSHRVRLGALTPHHARELALLVGGDAVMAGEIADQGGGSPYLVTEMVRAGARPGDFSLSNALLGRIVGLPADARRMLALLATAARPVGRPLLAAALPEQDASELERNLSRLLAEGLCRPLGDRSLDLFATYHDRIRQAVQQDLAKEQLAEYHRLLAEALAAHEPDNFEALAEHWLGAGETTRAAGHARQAAARAEASLAFERAARLYALALAHGDGTKAQRFELYLARGHSLVKAGRGSEAADVYAEALAVAPASEHVELRRLRSEQLLMCGRIDEGVAELRALMKAEGLSLPANALEAQARAKDLVDQLMARGFEFTPRAPDQLDPELLRRVNTLWAASFGFSMVDAALSHPLIVEYLMSALDLGDRLHIVRGLSLFQQELVGSLGGGPGPALDLAESIAAGLDDGRATGWVALSRGFCEYMRMRPDTALPHFELAEKSFSERCTGVARELGVARCMVVSSLILTGRLSRLAGVCAEWLQDARERKDIFVTTYLQMLSYQNLLAAGDEQRAEQTNQLGLAAWSRPETDYVAIVGLVVGIWIAGYAGGDRAYRLATEADERFLGSLYAYVPYTRMLYFWSRATSGLVAARQLDDTDERDAILADVEASIEQLRALSMVWSDALVPQLEAGVHACRGRRDTARQTLLTAIDLMRKEGSFLTIACMERRLGQLEGGETGAARVADADQTMRMEGIFDPERWTELYVPGAFV